MRRVSVGDIQLFDQHGYVILKQEIQQDELENAQMESQRLIDQILGVCVDQREFPVI